MSTIRAIIIDDESHCIEALQTKLADYCPDVSILGTCTTVADGIDAIRTYKPDIVFLDINMPVEDGFSVLEKIKDFTFEVIFTTAHDKYAVKAFKFNALHFLLKPIRPEELIDAVRRYKERKGVTSLKQVLSCIEQIRHEQQGINKIALPVFPGYRFVELKDIIWLESDSNYTKFYITNSLPLVVAKTLKEYDFLLKEKSFIRIHNSHSINLDHIKEYNKSSGIVMMTDNSKLEVAARRRSAFLEQVEKFIKI